MPQPRRNVYPSQRKTESLPRLRDLQTNHMQRQRTHAVNPETRELMMPNILTQSGYNYHQYQPMPEHYIPTHTHRPPHENDKRSPIPHIINAYDIVQDSNIDGQKNSAQDIYVFTSTMKTPTRKPPSSYHELQPSTIHNYRPVNTQHPKDGSTPGTQTPVQSYPSHHHNHRPSTHTDDIDKKDQISQHPDGPDYSSGTLIHLPGSGGAAPFQVGMDLYPIKDIYDNLDKQDIYEPPSYKLVFQETIQLGRKTQRRWTQDGDATR